MSPGFSYQVLSLHLGEKCVFRHLTTATLAYTALSSCGFTLSLNVATFMSPVRAALTHCSTPCSTCHLRHCLRGTLPVARCFQVALDPILYVLCTHLQHSQMLVSSTVRCQSAAQSDASLQWDVPRA